MIERLTLTPIGKDILAMAEEPSINYKDHLNKIARVQKELANLLGKQLNNPQVRGTAVVLCGEWRG